MYRSQSWANADADTDRTNATINGVTRMFPPKFLGTGDLRSARTSIGFCLLLLLERRAEHRLHDVGLEVAVGGVDERVWSAAPQLRVFLEHPVLSGMISERNVARQRAHDLERAVELVDDRGRQHPLCTQAAM